MKLTGLMVLILLIALSCGRTINEAIDDRFWNDRGELREDVKERMAEEASKLRCLGDVEVLMKQFDPIPEPMPINYEPSIETVFARNLHGNCISAAVLAQWALKQTGKSSRAIRLYTDKRHVIVISNDNAVLIDGHFVTVIEPDKWIELIWEFYDCNVFIDRGIRHYRIK